MSVTLEQLEAFLREPPPRHVPRNILRRRLRYSMGWVGYLLGGWFFTLGSFITATFFPWRLPQELLLDIGTPARAMAVVQACEPTNMHVNGRPVHRVRYQFRTAAGKQIAGTCYVTGNGSAQGRKWGVEYVAKRPEWNRLEGGHVNAFGYWGLFTPVIPLVGGLTLWLSWRARRRAVHLLSHGLFALGRVTDVQATNVRVNNQPRFRVIVEYEASGQPLTARYHAYGEDVELARRHQSNGEKIGLLYDPDRPQHVLFAESLLG